MRTSCYILMLSITLTGIVSAQTAVPDTVKSAPGITIETSIDKAEIYIGDLINYRLTIIHDSTIILTPPPIGANLGSFDVKDYQMDQSTKLKGGRVKSESKFLLTTFTTGDYIIPPIPVEFKLSDGSVHYLISEPTPIRVKSILAESKDTADIRDIKGPIYFKINNAKYYYLAAAVLALLAVGAYVYWRVRRRRQGPPQPVDLRKPWEIAFEALAVLKERNYPAAGSFKQFYIELTEIIRAFFARIYDIPVLDMTTEEFLGAFIDKDISQELYERVKHFLYHADLVKFAKLIPEPERVAVDFDEAVNIVESVRQTEVAKEATPPAAIVPETREKADV